MRPTRTLLAVIAMLLLLVTCAGAAGLAETIEVFRNQVKIEANGRVLGTDTFQYNGATYAPVQDVARALGAQVGWAANGSTLTISQDARQTARTVTYAGQVDAMNPALQRSQLAVLPDALDAFRLERNGQPVAATLEFTGDLLRLKPEGYLDYNATYALKLFLADGTRTIVAFRTGGLPSLAPGPARKLVFVPAMPDMGFNYPYYLMVPSKASVDRNAGKRNYLMVETHNTGEVSDDLNFHIQEAQHIAWENSAFVAEDLGLPRIVPILVRPASLFADKAIYTHALTRNAILLDQFKKEVANYPPVFNDMDRVDLQVAAMIKHANSILRQSGWSMEEKVFMWGFSASGRFTNHFTFLHPELVKAACYGGFPVPPVAAVGDTNLIYPLGTYDYEQITGRPFNLAAYNSVAKLGYIGSADRNNPTLAWDIWSPEEQAIIHKVLAVAEYPDQWNKYKALFDGSGGEAQANVYLGAGHDIYVGGMTQDYLNFFAANRASDKPVYVKPSDPANTLSDIYSREIVQANGNTFGFDKTTITAVFWTGSEPVNMTPGFVNAYKTTRFYTTPSPDRFMIAIAEWDITRDYNQMEERRDRLGRYLTLKAEGHKDVTVELYGYFTVVWGLGQAYEGRIVNLDDMVPGVPYKFVDPTGHWVSAEGVAVTRPVR